MRWRLDNALLTRDPWILANRFERGCVSLKFGRPKPQPIVHGVFAYHWILFFHFGVFNLAFGGSVETITELKLLAEEVQAS